LIDGHQWFGHTHCLCLHYCPQDGGTGFPQKADTYLPNCVASHTKKTIILRLTPIRSSDLELRMTEGPVIALIFTEHKTNDLRDGLNTDMRL